MNRLEAEVPRVTSPIVPTGPDQAPELNPELRTLFLIDWIYFGSTKAIVLFLAHIAFEGNWFWSIGVGVKG